MRVPRKRTIMPGKIGPTRHFFHGGAENLTRVRQQLTGRRGHRPRIRLYRRLSPPLDVNRQVAAGLIRQNIRVIGILPDSEGDRVRRQRRGCHGLPPLSTSRHGHAGGPQRGTTQTSQGRQQHEDNDPHHQPRTPRPSGLTPTARWHTITHRRRTNRRGRTRHIRRLNHLKTIGLTHGALLEPGEQTLTHTPTPVPVAHRGIVVAATNQRTSGDHD